MKKLFLILALFLIPSGAFGQCNGVFANGTVCGNNTGASNTPRAVSPASLLGAAGGTNGQVQVNSAGTLAGLTNTQLTADINTFTSSLSGAAPASGGGTVNFLRADDTWVTTVVSITCSSNLLCTAANPITSSGTIDLSANRKTLVSGCAINATATATCADGSAGANNGTYTTPAGALWLEVELIGGGGGGAGSGTSPGAVGSASATTFGTALLNGTGGGAANGATAGVGGIPTGAAAFVLKTGGVGGGGSGAANSPGGSGCVSPYGGGGQFGQIGTGAGGPATANTGSGGGGGGITATVNSGGGGGCGGFIRAIIQNPNATYTYAIGAGGTGGTAGTSGAAGGNGGSGYIQIIPRFN